MSHHEFPVGGQKAGSICLYSPILSAEAKLHREPVQLGGRSTANRTMKMTPSDVSKAEMQRHIQNIILHEDHGHTDDGRMNPGHRGKALNVRSSDMEDCLPGHTL